MRNNHLRKLEIHPFPVLKFLYYFKLVIFNKDNNFKIIKGKVNRSRSPITVINFNKTVRYYKRTLD